MRRFVVSEDPYGANLGATLCPWSMATLWADSDPSTVREKEREMRRLSMCMGLGRDAWTARGHYLLTAGPADGTYRTRRPAYVGECHRGGSS